mmetsp:Transcript_34555/g.63785  ORF Transcript_34555/g.63785 Transcript_34555/m.63785 type:complete len:323 (+) Transcript_34555:1555-2523(+)
MIASPPSASDAPSNNSPPTSSSSSSSACSASSRSGAKTTPSPKTISSRSTLPPWTDSPWTADAISDSDADSDASSIALASPTIGEINMRSPNDGGGGEEASSISNESFTISSGGGATTATGISSSNSFSSNKLRVLGVWLLLLLLEVDSSATFITLFICDSDGIANDGNLGIFLGGMLLLLIVIVVVSFPNMLLPSTSSGRASGDGCSTSTMVVSGLPTTSIRKSFSSLTRGSGGEESTYPSSSIFSLSELPSIATLMAMPSSASLPASAASAASTAFNPAGTKLLLIDSTRAMSAASFGDGSGVREDRAGRFNLRTILMGK